MIQREFFLGQLLHQLFNWEMQGDRQPETSRLLMVAEGLGRWAYQEMANSGQAAACPDMAAYGALLADLKNALGGSCAVLKGGDNWAVLALKRCPFQEVIRQSPCMCMVTAGVFGVLTRCRFGYGRVVLERTIATGAPWCRIAVYATPGVVEVGDAVSLEFPASAAARLHEPAEVVGRGRPSWLSGGGRQFALRCLTELQGIRERLEDNLVRGLINDSFTLEDSEFLGQQLVNLGRCLAETYRVLLVTRKPEGSLEVPGRRSWRKVLRRRMRQSAPDSLAGRDDQDGMVVLVPGKEYEVAELVRLCQEDLQRCGHEGLTMSVGGPSQSLPNIRRSYLQAAIAMRVLERLGPAHKDIFFEHLGIYSLFYYLEELPLAREAAMQMLRPLIEYDDRRHTYLLSTLETYFACECKFKKTADALFIHPTTLKYRLQRAQQLGGFNLANMEDRLSVLMSLRFIKLNVR